MTTSPNVGAVQEPINDAQPVAEAVDDVEKRKKSQASELVAFVEEKANLFHDQNRVTYAQDRESGEVRRIESGQFKDWLTAAFYHGNGKAARDQSIREALSTLSGLARMNGLCVEVHIRVAKHEGTYYIDLGERGQNRAVRVTKGAWQVVVNPPVRFFRPESLRPLPEPVHGGSIEILWQIANIPEDGRLLVLAWMLDCFRPDTPFPVLELIGEQGSAKSTTQTALRRLVDPNSCNLRAAPKVVDDIFVGAGTNYLVSYENISHLAAPMQDAFCVLATGGGFAKRKLYSDADESIINVKRPVILNGISVAVTAQDLVDRAVSLELPLIDERAEGTTLWEIFERNQATIFGGMLDLMAKALAELPSTTLSPRQRPRLIEFARFGMAIAKASGQAPERFLDQFNASRQEAIARTLDASPVATAVMEWFEGRNRAYAEMPLKELMESVRKPEGAEAWPRSAKGFGDALRRVATALRQSGIEAKSLGKVGGNIRWAIADITENEGVLDEEKRSRLRIH